MMIMAMAGVSSSPETRVEILQRGPAHRTPKSSPPVIQSSSEIKITVASTRTVILAGQMLVAFHRGLGIEGLLGVVPTV